LQLTTQFAPIETPIAIATAIVVAKKLKMKITNEWLWPTPVMFVELMGAEVDKHNENLEQLVIKRCDAQKDTMHELRLHDLHLQECESIGWLEDVVRVACANYCQFESTTGIEVGFRGVVLRQFDHINTHTESRESDLGVAYWPSGNRNQIGQQINQNADGLTAPIFTMEDPSRHLSDLRLPTEMRHSVDICPRPGLLAIYPAHLPHNVHPYKGSKPFVHIVAQVRMPWPENYFRGNL
jgi:hypothetical protein